MTVPYGPDQPGSQPPPPPGQPSWAPPAYPSAPPPGAPAPPLQGYAVPGSWGAPGWRPTRPGTVTAAVVITYIQAGLSVLIIVAALALRTQIEVTGTLDALLGVAAVITLVFAALYVVAAVQLQRGQNRGFLLGLTIASIALNVIQTVGTIVAARSGQGFGGTSLCSLALPVTVLILLLQPASKAWIDANRNVRR